MNHDLTKYMYQHFEDALNIGWNSNEKEADISSINQTFYDNLRIHCEYPLNKDLNGRFRECEINGEKFVKGFGEIRILDLKRRIRYAAPNIILDDILEGVYIPGENFVEAVKISPKPGDIEYREFLNRYHFDFYWGEDEERVNVLNTVVQLLEKDTREFREYIKDEKLINCVTHDGSLLNYAINKGKTDDALYFIETGIDINMFSGIELLNAIENNLTEVAEMLINHDIYMDFTEMKTNPLVYAIRYGNAGIVQKLLEKDLRLLQTYSNEFVQNCSMLDVALKCGDSDIIKLVKRYL